MTVTRAALADAAGLARLAPSSHNCQPWAIASCESDAAQRAVCEWAGTESRSSDEHWLVLGVDTARALEALPTLATEMRLSCGMFLQLFAGALAEQGFAVRVVSRDAGARGLRLDGYPSSWSPLAAVAVPPGSPRRPAWSSALASRRRTNRAAYEARPVDRDVQHALRHAEALFAREPDPSPVSVNLIADPQAVRAVGTFVGKHANVDFTHADAWRETYRFMRFGTREIETATDGFAITQLLGPTPAVVRQLLRLGLSPTAMRMLRYVGIPTAMARALGALVGAAPLLVCVSVDRRSPGTELVAGGVAMDVWMRATAAGLALHPVSAILQHDDLRERFQRTLGLAGRAVFFARVGYPTATFPSTPRRSLEPGHPSQGWVRL